MVTDHRWFRASFRRRPKSRSCRFYWTRLRSSLRCELRRGKPGFRPDYYPHLTPGVFMEFVFFTTKDTKRTKKPDLRVLRALRGVLSTCRAFATASAMLIHAALHKTKLPQCQVWVIVKAFAGETRVAGMAGARGWHWQLFASVAKQQEAKRPPGLRPPATSCRCHPSASCGHHYGDNAVVIPCDRLPLM